MVPKVRAAVLEQMKAAGWPVTVSVGVLTCGHVPASQDDMLKRVDDLMYEVKRSGKDGVRFEVCTGEGPHGAVPA